MKMRSSFYLFNFLFYLALVFIRQHLLYFIIIQTMFFYSLKELLILSRCPVLISMLLKNLIELSTEIFVRYSQLIYFHMDLKTIELVPVSCNIFGPWPFDMKPFKQFLNVILGPYILFFIVFEFMFFLFLFLYRLEIFLRYLCFFH